MRGRESPCAVQEGLARCVWQGRLPRYGLGGDGQLRQSLIRRTAVVRTRMPGGEGGEASRGAPLSRLTAIRMAEAQLAVPSSASLPANSSAPSWATGVKRAARYTPSNAHNFPRGTEDCRMVPGNHVSVTTASPRPARSPQSPSGRCRTASSGTAAWSAVRRPGRAARAPAGRRPPDGGRICRTRAPGRSWRRAWCEASAGRSLLAGIRVSHASAEIIEKAPNMAPCVKGHHRNLRQRVKP